MAKQSIAQVTLRYSEAFKLKVVQEIDKGRLTIAEATELPVGERPPVSVANGFCHPWPLDPGSSPG